MELKELGEFGFIARIADGAVVAPERVAVAIGDDCAVVPGRPGFYALCTTDLLVERVHFLREQIAPRQLGVKAMQVNLSDVAAMGGRPLDAFLSLAVPPGLAVEYLDELLSGVKAAAAAAQVNLLGGDTTASRADLVINVALTGEVACDRVLLRSGGRAGDRLFVSGTLGDSAAGLEALLWRRADSPIAAALVQRHLAPRAQLAEGRAIAATGLAHAMLDLSDGLSSDVGHLCRASGLGCIVEAARLPLSSALVAYCAAYARAPLDFALHGGEDYLLCFAGEPALATALADAGVEAVEIGELTAAPERWLQLADGRRVPLLPGGWDHFRGVAAEVG